MPDGERKLAEEGVDGSGSEDAGAGEEGGDEDLEFPLDEADLLFDLSEEEFLPPLGQAPLSSMNPGTSDRRDEPDDVRQMGVTCVGYEGRVEAGSLPPWSPMAAGGAGWPLLDSRTVIYPSKHARVDGPVSVEPSQDGTWASSAGSYDSAGSGGGQGAGLSVYSPEVGLSLLRQACSAPVHPYQEAGGDWRHVVGGAARPNAAPSVAVYVPRRLAAGPGEDMGIIYHWVCAELASLQAKGGVDPSKATFVGYVRPCRKTRSQLIGQPIGAWAAEIWVSTIPSSPSHVLFSRSLSCVRVCVAAAR